MAHATQFAIAEERDLSLARQPILTKEEQVVGYEVLFRNTSDGSEAKSGAHGATGSILDAVNRLGTDLVCDGRLAFIHCTEELLAQDALLALPADRVVVEIPLDIRVNSTLLEACQRHRKKGYKIALDRFRKNDHRAPLVAFADYLKVDRGLAGVEEPLRLSAIGAGKACKMLAQNVASRAEYRSAAKAGFTLFQGYFFYFPESIRVRQVPARQVSRMRLLQAVAMPEIDFKLVDELIRQDASLCYRLLRFLNSPLLGFAAPVRSVHQAVVLLGARALTQWVRTATAMSMGQPKCSDLVLASLLRARFCELIAPKVGHGDADLFLFGMFSLMDVILETPMEILVEGLALGTSAKAALLAMRNGGGARLSPILDLVAAREKGDWERVTTEAEKLKLSLTIVNSAYIEAMQWAYDLTNAANTRTASPPARPFGEKPLLHSISH